MPDIEVQAWYEDDPNQPLVFRGKTPEKVAEAIRAHRQSSGRKIQFDSSQHPPEFMSLFQKPGAARPTLPTPDPAAEMQMPHDATNALLRRGLRLGAGGLGGFATGGGGRGAALSGLLNLGGGELADKMFGETHNTAPQKGEIAGEILGSTLGPLARFFPGLTSPVVRETLGGLGAGGASTWGTDAPAEYGAALGGATGLMSSLLGTAVQNRARVSGGETNRTVGGTIQKELGVPVDPSTPERAVDRGEMRDIGLKLLQEYDKVPGKSVAGAVNKLTEEVPFAVGQKLEENKRLAARTAPLMQAANQKKSAEVNLRSERSQDAVRKMLENKEVAELEAKIARIPGPAEKQPLQRELEAKLLGLAASRANTSPEIKKAMSGLKTAEAIAAKVQSIQAKAKSKVEADKLSRDVAESFYNDIKTQSGFDPQDIAKSPEKAAALKWAANAHPEVMLGDFFEKRGLATDRAHGVIKLFGPNSNEVKSIRRGVVSHIFDQSIEGAGEGAGKAYSASKLGAMLDKVNPQALDALFENQNTHKVLRDLESLIGTNAAARAKRPLRGILSAGVSGGSVVLALSSERDIPSYLTALGAFTLGGIVANSASELIEKIMAKNNGYSSALRRYMSNPSPGNAAVLLAAGEYGKMAGDAATQKSTEPIE